MVKRKTRLAYDKERDETCTKRDETIENGETWLIIKREMRLGL